MLNKCKIKQFIRECENATFRIDELDLLYKTEEEMCLAKMYLENRIEEDILEIAWLIGNHMKLKKDIDKDKFSNIIGYDDYLRLEALDNADNSAK